MAKDEEIKKKSNTTTKKVTTKNKTAAPKKTTTTKKTVKKNVTKNTGVNSVNKERKVVAQNKDNSKVKANSKVNKKEKFDVEETWLYVFLLSVVTLLGASIKNYTFTYYGADISFSIFVLPFVYFIANYITKKYDYVECLKAIFASSVIMILYVVLADLILGREILFTEVAGSALGYMGSQIVNLTFYYFLLVYAEGHGLLVFMTYIFATLVNSFVYILFAREGVVLDTFWTSFITTLILQAIMYIPLAFIDSQIKRGLAE